LADFDVVPQRFSAFARTRPDSVLLGIWGALPHTIGGGDLTIGACQVCKKNNEGRSRHRLGTTLGTTLGTALGTTLGTTLGTANGSPKRG
jgi:hypothetical protein